MDWFRGEISTASDIFLRSNYCLFLSFHFLQHLFFLSLIFFLSFLSSLIVFSSVGTVSLSFSLAYFCLPPLPLVSLTSPLRTLHSLPFTLFCFFHTLILFPTWLAEDLVTSTPPKPTKARRFLLPFVFCSDSPPNGILWSFWTVFRGEYPQNCDVAE